MTVRPGRSLIRAAAAMLAGSPLVFAWDGVILIELVAVLLLVRLAVADYFDLKRRLADVRVERRLLLDGGLLRHVPRNGQVHHRPDLRDGRGRLQGVHDRRHADGRRRQRRERSRLVRTRHGDRRRDD